MNPFRILSPSLAIFTLAYTAGFGAYAIWARNAEFVFYLVVMVALIAGVLVLHSRVGLSQGVLWGLSAWGLLHMAGGNVPLPADAGVLYNFWFIPGRLKYDHVTHAYGFGIATWAAWQCLASIGVSAGAGAALSAMLMGLGLGAINEVVEFVATLTIPDTNVGGYVNTGWDLVANWAGAATAAGLLWAFHGRGRAAPEVHKP